MALAAFSDLMGAAEAGRYAVGYFESWDLHSLLAVGDAAELARSPVLLGFSGYFLDHPSKNISDPLGVYSSMGLELCRSLSVPAALLYNESPSISSVLEAARLGFGLVMFSDESLSLEVLTRRVKQITEEAHRFGAAVEGEIAPLPGVGGDLDMAAVDPLATDPESALRFAAETGIDALAVNLGQVHLHGRRKTTLDLERLSELRRVLSIPLVLHGATSIPQADLREAVSRGIRKINFGSILKQRYFESLRASCRITGDNYNPYNVIGSGLDEDILTIARLALRDKVVELMKLIGSADRA